MSIRAINRRLFGQLLAASAAVVSAPLPGLPTPARSMRFPAGMVMPWLGGDEVPEGWLSCAGQMLNAENHRDLFKAIGYVYGRTIGKDDEFAIPDLRGRVASDKPNEPVMVVQYIMAVEDYEAVESA